MLDVRAKNRCTVQSGDNCSTNVKAAATVESKIGIKAPFSRCASHASHGTIRRLCTSETMCHEEAKLLYNNLRKLLLHFQNSTKSTELLNNALKNLDMHQVSNMNW